MPVTVGNLEHELTQSCSTEVQTTNNSRRSADNLTSRWYMCPVASILVSETYELIQIFIDHHIIENRRLGYLATISTKYGIDDQNNWVSTAFHIWSCLVNQEQIFHWGVFSRHGCLMAMILKHAPHGVSTENCWKLVKIYYAHIWNYCYRNGHHQAGIGDILGILDKQIFQGAFKYFFALCITKLYWKRPLVQLLSS